MRFDDLLADVADEPVFETGLLLAGDRDPGDVIWTTYTQGPTRGASSCDWGNPG